MKVTTKFALVFSVMVLMASAAQAAIVGHWTFDEGSGSTAYDSANGFNGTITGATYTTGQIGSGALTFDGNTANVFVPYNANLALVGSDYTMSFWVNWAGQMPADKTQVVLSNENGNDFSGGYEMSFHRDLHSLDGGVTYNKYDFKANQLDGLGDQGLWSGQAPTGTWTHVAMVYDGTNRYLYRDGVLDTTQATTAVVADSQLSGLTIGAAYAQYAWKGYGFNGALDDLQIYNRTLSSDEVLSVMAGNVVDSPLPEPSSIVLVSIGVFGLLAYAWRKRK